MGAAVLIAQLKNMNILAMKKNANSAVLHRMVVAVLIVRLKNTDMGMDKINVFGAVQHQMVVVVRIAQQKNMKNNPSSSLCASASLRPLREKKRVKCAAGAGERYSSQSPSQANTCSSVMLKPGRMATGTVSALLYVFVKILES